uniref:Triplex capsid protein 2 n=1 Tax=Ascaris lumbricoides TaxID=6252 RepID=A0A0M3IAL4_ASCLU
MRLANTDQLLRAERILRAATGIAHPPDVGATVPVSYREYVPVEAQKACDMMLLPLQIPSGVEGAIPRVWAVQRRLAGALDGVLPFALRVSRFLSETSFPADVSRRIFSTLYADSSAIGIAHPPDVGATVPVSYREYVPVEAQKACDMMLLPLQIPSGVEGAIPRVWAVQRRLAGALDGVLPFALRVSRFLSETSFPADVSRRIFSTLYADSSAIVSVLRASGDIQMDSQRIQSILLYPSLPDSVKAAFTFVQCGSDIMLSVSADAFCFPEPDKLLVHFKAEVRCLLDQLSMRLLTLSQATFLPTRVPFMLGTSASTEAVITLEPKPSVAGIENIDVESCSVEQLQLLLRNVQGELDSMRSSPHIDRAEYVNKLNELENRMRIFHDSMAARLGAPVCTPLREGAELASDAVEELLAPYKQDNAPTARRFSREFARIDIPRKSSRAD